MKGVIITCLESLVKEQFGPDSWEDILEEAGLERHALFNITSNVEDEAVMEIVNATCKVLNLTLPQAADTFGDYWVNVYAPKVYSMYFRKAHSAKEMLLNMDKLHETVTASIPDARPPRFGYEWQDENILIMHYKSDRDLLDFFIGLIKGAGKYYNEELRVAKRGEAAVEIVFAGQSATKSSRPDELSRQEHEQKQAEADSSAKPTSEADESEQSTGFFQKIVSFFK
ncbi:MAG: hypothetical protein D3904_16005 [Candidatus Electrothrix sp. EH2]|nr:hypothetical protein [Candidatus Electrothrix sp. EH2]